MRIKFEGSTGELNAGIEHIKSQLNIEVDDKGIPLHVQQSSGDIEISFIDNKGSIRYNKKIEFFRALGLFIQNAAEKESFTITEKRQFNSSGVLIDCSRNAVLSVQSTKRILSNMAVMGLNLFMLYTEDTYSIEDEPYFGYMRGRYSFKELKECDDYADDFGIEMMPCIQTLAHLEQFLKWMPVWHLRDTRDVLLIGEDKVYALIEKMIKAASAPFRSKRIHIGMDEAYGMGRGVYLDRHGNQDKFKTLTDHLNKVVAITSKYGLKPMMWSDMFFSVGSKTKDYYDQDVNFPDFVAKCIPNEVELIYWDYYHNDEEFYEKHIEKHYELTDRIGVATGIWTWHGIGTNYGKSFSIINASLTACKKHGIKDVFPTTWGDDGNENNHFNILLGLQLTAEHSYRKDIDMDDLKKRFKFCTGIEYQAMYDLSYLDETPGVLQGNNADPVPTNPSKLLLWQDLLLGVFDKHVESLSLEEHYRKYEKVYKEYKTRFENQYPIFNVPEKLCSVLALKADLGNKIKAAYEKKDVKILKQISDKILPDLSVKVAALREAHRSQWFKTYKPFGWEVLDIRYGGLIARIDSVRLRLTDYTMGAIDRIEELEEVKLYFDGKEYPSAQGLGSSAQHHRIAGPGSFFHDISF